MSETQTAVLADRAQVGVSGPDTRNFLQGLLTQEVETLAKGELRYGALLTPQGRLRFDLFLWGGADGVVLDVAAAGRDELVQALALYRLRAKVRIAPLDEPVIAAWGDAPGGDGWASDRRLPTLGWRRIGATSTSGGDYHAHRIALDVADPAVDGIEPLYPIEANLDLLHGIDFRKGCFVGQETTSRMKRRGQNKTRIAPITYDGPQIEPGAEVMAGGLRAGRVLSGVDGRSLALLRIDRAAGAALTALDRPLALDVPSWLEDAFALAKPPVEA